MKTLIKLVIFSFFFTNISFAEIIMPTHNWSSKPKCEGEDENKWTNCYGTYLKKKINNNQTRDYSGEFGSIAGIRHGKGSSIVYRNKKKNIVLCW